MNKSIGIGIIGAGGRGIRNLGSLISRREQETKLHVAAICDRTPGRLEQARQHLEGVLKEQGKSRVIKTYLTPMELVADPDVNLVMVTSPQSVHEEGFQAASEAGKPIYCEKPLAHSMESCERMYQCWLKHRKAPCFIGLTRRYENVWRRAREITAQGAIGKPQMLLLRSIIPYSRYFHLWHRQKKLSGDILNEKCSHHFDVLNWFAQSIPNRIYATGGRNVFTPREGYPERCSECDKECAYRACPQGTGVDDPGGFEGNGKDGSPIRDACVYSPTADILDHAIVTLDYPNGIRASLFVTIFGYDTEDLETLEVIGDEGKLLLTRRTGSIQLTARHGLESASIDCSGEHFKTGHHGADITLVNDLSRFVHFNQPAGAGFQEAYWASKIAFLAQDSIASGQPQLLRND